MSIPGFYRHSFCSRRLISGVKELLNNISAILDAHVLTAGTFGMVCAVLDDVRSLVYILAGNQEDRQKEAHVKKLGEENAIALGNGNNDRKILKAARIKQSVLKGSVHWLWLLRQ